MATEEDQEAALMRRMKSGGGWANVVVPTTTDPVSRTPAFKAVLITIEATASAGAGDEQANGRKGRMPLEVVRGS